jgi:endonuclease/exonuclease/phosphatase family metal-dependent hydrolase
MAIPGLNALEEESSYLSSEGIGKGLISFGQANVGLAEWATEGVIRSVFTTTEAGRIGNYDCYHLEVIRRLFVCGITLLFSPVLIVAALIGKSCMAIGDFLTGKESFYIKGEAPEKEFDRNFKIMTHNACMFFGGLPIRFGVSNAASARIPGTVALIKQTDPDILFLQEVSFGPARNLIHQLKDTYAHFFTRIGPSNLTMETCLFVASKVPILNYEYVPFRNNQNDKSRGYFVVETEQGWFINTHLSAGGKENAEERKAQLAQIHAKMKALKERNGKTSFLLGDLNVSEKEEYKNSGLIHNFYDGRHAGKRPEEINQETATCTNYFQAYTLGKEKELCPEEELEIDDYALCLIEDLHAPGPEIERIPAFTDWKKPEEALSDHHALLLKIRFD